MYNPIMRCFRLFLTWKDCDTNGATYWSLRTTLDKYSIFCGRNPVSYWLKLVESAPFKCFCDVFTCRYQWWLMLGAVRLEEHPLNKSCPVNIPWSGLWYCYGNKIRKHNSLE